MFINGAIKVFTCLVRGFPWIWSGKKVKLQGRVRSAFSNLFVRGPFEPVPGWKKRGNDEDTGLTKDQVNAQLMPDSFSGPSGPKISGIFHRFFFFFCQLFTSDNLFVIFLIEFFVYGSAGINNFLNHTFLDPNDYRCKTGAFRNKTNLKVRFETQQRRKSRYWMNNA